MNFGLRASSGRRWHLVRDTGITAMLARRFVLICLAISPFAMGVAVLLAKSERPRRWVELQSLAEAGKVARRQGPYR